jgi:hypothetical protein
LNKKRLDQKLIMARSGGVVNLFAANFKFNRLNDLRHSVAAVKLEPPDLRRHHQFERNSEAGFAAQASSGSARSMTNGGEGTFNEVCCADMLTVVCRV